MDPHRTVATNLVAAEPSAAVTRRWTVAAVPVASSLLTAIGLAGIGDAPNPRAPSADIAAWFDARHNAVLDHAVIGYAGAALLIATGTQLARRLRDHELPAAAALANVGAALAAAYLATCHIAWSVIASDPTIEPATAKTVFVATVVATPVLALGVSLLIATTSRLAPKQIMRRAGAGLATVTAIGIVATRPAGWFSADVQQQFVANVLLAWLLVTGVAQIWRRHLSPTYLVTDPSKETAP